MDRARSARQKKISQLQEKRVASQMDGRTQAASGATRMGGGGDVRAPGYRIECKYTESLAYCLKNSDLRKLKDAAFKSLEQPVMQVGFVDNLGKWTLFAVVRRILSAYAGPIIPARISLMVPREHVLIALTERKRFGVRFREEPEVWEFLFWDDFYTHTMAD